MTSKPEHQTKQEERKKPVSYFEQFLKEGSFDPCPHCGADLALGMHRADCFGEWFASMSSAGQIAVNPQDAGGPAAATCSTPICVTAAAGTRSAGGGVGNSPGASANKSGQGGATTGNKARNGVANH